MRLFFFFNDTATTEIYTLSLHDALPILGHESRGRLVTEVHGDPRQRGDAGCVQRVGGLVRRILGHVLLEDAAQDRKSTRLNSSHSQISYAVFCLKKKKKKI